MTRDLEPIDLLSRLRETSRAELQRVSHLEYDSQDICRHFHFKVLERLGPDMDDASRNLLDAAFKEQIVRVSHVPYESRNICETFHENLFVAIERRLASSQEMDVEARSPNR